MRCQTTKSGFAYTNQPDNIESAVEELASQISGCAVMNSSVGILSYYIVYNAFMHHKIRMDM